MATATMTEPIRQERTRPPQPQPQAPATRHARQNVGEIERWLSVAGGSALAAFGLSRRSLGGLALATLGGMLLHRGLTGRCMAYGQLGISTADRHGPAASVAAGHGVKVDQSITVDASPDKLYQFWRDLENLPTFMKYLDRVTTEGLRSHWVAWGPLGKTVEWDAEIHNERENEMLAWRSLPGSEVDTAGSVHFTPAPGNRGTEVRVVLKYDPPAGKTGAWIAGMLGRSPQQEIREDLRRFKQLMETGEIATVEGQAACRNS